MSSSLDFFLTIHFSPQENFNKVRDTNLGGKVKSILLGLFDFRPLEQGLMVLVCLMIIEPGPNTNPISVVSLSMTENERLIITTVWNDMTLRLKLEDDPYSLTQSELNGLQQNDRLNAHTHALTQDVLDQRLLPITAKHHV